MIRPGIEPIQPALVARANQLCHGACILFLQHERGLDEFLVGIHAACFQVTLKHNVACKTLERQ